MPELYAFESMRTSFLTVIGSIISFFGEEDFLIAALAVLYWCHDKKIARRIGFSFILAGNFSMILRNTVLLPRPWVIDYGFKPADSILLSAEGYSFPSMHTAVSWGMGVNFFYNFRKKTVKMSAVLFMILVPLSRMYLGAEALPAVLTAAAVSFIFSLFINRFIDGMVLDRSHYPLFCMGFCMLPVFSFVVFLAQYYNGIIEYSDGSLAVKMAGASIAFALSWLFEIRYVRFNERCDSLKKQLIKALVGLAIMIVLRIIMDSLISLFAPGFWPGEFMEYFIIIFVAIGIYPMFFRDFFSAAYQNTY